MNKSLVIVESPTKVKTISKYLGANYIVKSSIGHIRDLPISNSTSKRIKKTLPNHEDRSFKKNRHSTFVNRIGINPWCNWEAYYEILPNKEKIVTELRQLAEQAKRIYLATDLDREGEAIAWHLREVIGGNYERYSRVVFNEITKNAIHQAFKNPRELNMDRINAQQTRRFMDRIVGYMISPLLWQKIARGLSAGRVQSVAVRLIVEREREIKVFIPQEYWKINVDVATSNKDLLILQVTHYKDQLFCPKNFNYMNDALVLLKKARYQVLDRQDKLVINNPNAPFITSTLQQAANIHLGFGVKKTMLIAQLLYEAGYITYMRTDSTSLSQDAVNMARHYIVKNFGDKYLPEKANFYIGKKKTQEAHEAIRPSNVFILTDSLEDVDANAKRLYQLIWCQFIASQMTPAQYDSITLFINADDFRLKTYSKIMRFDGWTKLIPMSCKDKKNYISPIINIGDQLSLINIIPTQHFTKPPIRFNEALLVKELEKRGIGRPSTYASIITTIQSRGYVRINNNRFYAEKIGEIVIDRLKKNFRELMSYNFTAQMENSLDQIANHEIEWKKVLDNFFANFIDQLGRAKKKPEEGGMEPNKVVITNINCPNCNRKMGIRTAITGMFLSCSGYELPLERCKTTINMVLENEILNLLEEDNAEINLLRTKCRCKKCNAIMDSYFISLEQKLHVCSNNPTCDGHELEEYKISAKKYKDSIIKCNKCHSLMYFKIGRFGKYMACTNKACKNTCNILHDSKISLQKDKPIPLPELLCTQSNAYFVLRYGTSGIFLAANTFPKSCETRLPFVEELYRFRDRLPSKLHYLADAPQKNSEGHKTVVRFSRKTKQQYISAEKDGKSTGWSAFFINGKWVENKK